MGRKVDVDELLDARGVARALGLSHPNTVSVYQHRHADMPRPVVNLGEGRVKLWLEPEISAWAKQQSESGRTRPATRKS